MTKAKTSQVIMQGDALLNHIQKLTELTELPCQVSALLMQLSLLKETLVKTL